MHGLEFEGNYLVTDNFTLRATLGYLQAEYTDYCDIGLVDGLGAHAVATGRATFDASGAYPCYRVDGQEAKEQPEVTASLSPSYRANLGDTGLRWNLRADIRYETGQWRESANIAKTDELLLVNAYLGLSGDNWDATVYISNLTDNDTPRNYSSSEDEALSGAFNANIGPGPNQVRNYLITPRQPRTVGLRLNYNF